MSSRPGDRHRLTSVVILTTLLVGGCRSSSPNGGHRLTALQGVDNAVQLITEVVANVAPGATINDDGGSGPSPCSAPFKGDVYYGVYRSFDAPHDLAGTMLFDATVADLKGRGIKFAAPSTTGATGQDRNDIGSASLFGVEVIASAGTSRVQITIAAECGTP